MGVEAADISGEAMAPAVAEAAGLLPFPFARSSLSRRLASLLWRAKGLRISSRGDQTKDMLSKMPVQIASEDSDC